jgi:hypothetical protein
MKTMINSLGMLALATATMLTVSCKDADKNEAPVPMVNEMHQETITDSDNLTLNASQNANLEAVLKDYFNLKDALVADDTEHAEHIGKSDIKHQREHFKMLSKDITEMVAITGTNMKLYEQFCPMYDGGSAWLSMREEVRNPYYGSSMLTCGKVQREIN